MEISRKGPRVRAAARCYLFCVLGSALISQQLEAAEELIPFVDGQVARARDINTNFDYLDLKLEALVERINAPSQDLTVDCVGDPEALQRAIEGARGLGGELVVAAGGNCNRITVDNQHVTIASPLGNLKISNTGPSNASAAIEVRNGGVLSLIGFIRVDGGTGTAVNVTGQSYFLGAYTQIIGGNIGLAATWSNFVFVGNTVLSNTATAMSLINSHGLFLGKLGTNRFTCNNQPDGPPSCLKIGPNVSKAFELLHSGLILGAENTALEISATEARLNNLSSLSLRAGSVTFDEEFVIDRLSHLYASGDAGESLTINSDIQVVNGSVGNFDYENDSASVGALTINGNLESVLGSTFTLEGEVGDNPSITVNGSISAISANASALRVKITQESSAVAGDLVVDGYTFNEFDSASPTPALSAIMDGKIIIVRQAATDPKPTGQDVANLVQCSLEGKVYYLPLYDSENDLPTSYVCSGG